MDKVDEARVADLGARLERLETEYNRVPVRGVVGGGGGGGLNIQTVHVLPNIPIKRTIVFLESVPPDRKDTYWWAVPGDSRWHPFGGKIVDIAGYPGDM